MSAFIVGPDCINSIVTYVHQHANCFGWLRNEIGYDVQQAAELRRLAIALYLLNCAAVDQRYGKGTAAKDSSGGTHYTFRRVHRDSVAVHKAACCLRYQCCEGDVPEQPLYRALDSIISQIANDIIGKLAAYDKAPWGD
jgi:hypothetical protein